MPTRRLRPWWPGALWAVTPAFAPFVVDDGARVDLRYVIGWTWIVVGLFLAGVAVRAVLGRGIRPHGRIVVAAALGSLTCAAELVASVLPATIDALPIGVLVLLTLGAFVHLHAYRDTIDFVGLQRDVPPSLTGLTLLLILLGPILWILLASNPHTLNEDYRGAPAVHGLPSST